MFVSCNFVIIFLFMKFVFLLNIIDIYFNAKYYLICFYCLNILIFYNTHTFYSQNVYLIRIK